MRKLYIPLSLFVVLGLAACSAKKAEVKQPTEAEKPPVEATQPETPKATPDEPSLRGPVMRKSRLCRPCILIWIGTSLKAEARDTLRNYQEISKHSTWKLD